MNQGVEPCYWMLLIGLISLLLAIGLGGTQTKMLYSTNITPTLLTRITSIILLFSAALSFNGLYVQAIGSGLGLYSGLFHVTSVTQAMEVFLFTVGAFVLLPWAPSVPEAISDRYLYFALSSSSNFDFYPNKNQVLFFLNSVADKKNVAEKEEGKSKSQNTGVLAWKPRENRFTGTRKSGLVYDQLIEHVDDYPENQNKNKSLAFSRESAVSATWSINRSATTVVPENGSYSAIAEFPLIILFTTIGASFLISSSDLVSMYLSIELQSFAVYILASIYRNSESATSAGLKYFLLGALSSALILLGSRIIYAYAGLTSFEGIYMIASVASSNASAAPQPEILDMMTENRSLGDGIRNAVVLGVLIIGVGFLFKVAAAPFHNWAPDVYDGVPTIVTTWLTVMPKISIFVFLLELQIVSEVGLAAETSIMLSFLYPEAEGLNIMPVFLTEVKTGSQLGWEGTETLTSTMKRGAGMQLERLSFSRTNIWQNLLLTTSLLSLVVGTVVGLAQYRLKRLLAFSTISHVGFLLLALSVNSEESISSFLFYLMQYSITNLNTFFVVLAFGYFMHLPGKHADISFISQLKGQFHANPVLGLSLALCLFSMAGIPPLVGFFAKYRVLYSAIENGYYFLALVGILASVVSAAYYLRIIRVIHFDVPNSLASDANTSWGDRKSPSLLLLQSTHSYVIAVLTLFITLFILSPSLFLNSSNLLALSLFTA